jgi:phage gpG-like protein
VSISLSFTFDPSGAITVLRKARADLAGGRIAPGPFREGLKSAAVVYLDAQRRQFIRNSRGGGTWRPLAKSTVKQKKPNRGILRRSDRLLNSLTPGSPDNILQATPKGFRVGSRVDYGQFHMTGTGHMPKRPWLTPPDAQTVRRMRQEVVKGLGLQARQWAKVNVRVARAAFAAAPAVPMRAA